MKLRIGRVRPGLVAALAVGPCLFLTTMLSLAEQIDRQTDRQTHTVEAGHAAAPVRYAMAKKSARLPPFYINNLAPFAYSENGVMTGVVYDLINEFAHRHGMAGTINSVPFNRVTAMLNDDPSSVGAIWRQPENERAYTWIVKLLEERMMLVARSDTALDISSVAAARHLRVGVVLGSPAEVIARRLGFDHIEAVSSAESNARKLALGRIDAWLAVPGVIAHGERRIGADMSSVRFGVQVEPVTMYLACALRCNGAQVSRLRVTFDAMNQDQTYARILRKYHY